MVEERGRILVVDDDEAVRRVLGALLAQAGHTVTAVGSAAEALARLSDRSFDVCVTDVRMPGMDGIELSGIIGRRHPDVSVVMLSAHATVALAVEAMRRGACDFVQKPFERDEVLFVVEKALKASRGGRSRAASRSDLMIGASPALTEVQDLVRRAARGRSTVLVRGESGTGKELIARAVHAASPRANGPFVAVHCGALPESLLESELFGYEKGAFTGAATRKPGRVELAEGGTLFLDEIGDISPAVQLKLLRLLQERQYERLGGKETLTADVRFVAATHADLEELVRSGAFREDLFYRLSVVPVRVPPLRERRDDIPDLARHFCAAASKDSGVDVVLNDAAVDLLARQEWPGNVRQLENFVERMVVLSEGPQISERDVLSELAREPGLSAVEGPRAGGLFVQRRAAERDALERALERSGNNRTAAARMLGVSRRTLYKKMASLGVG